MGLDELLFDELPEFQKDHKRLAKRKCRKLADDLQLFKKAVSIYPLGKGKSQRFDVIFSK